jgi:hypothetical protein
MAPSLPCGLIVAGLGKTGKRFREPEPASSTPVLLPAAQSAIKGDGSMGKGKMSGDNSADSKRTTGKARGSGGTMKNQNPGKQDNNKAQNTKSNKQ